MLYNNLSINSNNIAIYKEYIMKKIFATLCALSLVTGAAQIPALSTVSEHVLTTNAASASYTFTKNNVKWTYTYANGVNKSGGYKITGATIVSGTAVNVPATATDGTSIVEIGDNFLKGNTVVKTVSTPSSVKKIGGYFCYNATKLTSVTLGNNTEYLGDYAMYGCSSMTSLSYSGSSLYHFGYGSLWCNKYADTYKANNPSKSALVIGNMLYRYYDKVTSINFGNTINGKYITYINDYAFSADNYTYGPNLTSVNLKGVKYIGQKAFYKCSNLANVGLDDRYFNTGNINGIFHNNTHCWFYTDYGTQGCINSVVYNGSNTSLSVPSTLNGKSIVAIGNAFLSGDSKYTAVSFGNGIKEIGNSFGCDSTELKSVTLPASLEKMGSYTLYNSKLENLSFSQCANVKEIGDGSFWCCPWNDNYFVNNPSENAIIFGTYLYRYNKNVTSLDFSQPVCGKMINYIGYDALSFNAYSGKTGIRSVNLGTTVQAIYGRAFSGCTNLRTVTGGSNLNTIGSNAFNSTTMSAIESAYGNSNYVLLGNALLKWKASGTSVDLAVINNGNLRGIGSDAFAGKNVKKLYLPTHGDFRLANLTIPASVEHVYYGGANNSPLEYNYTNINNNSQMNALFYPSLNAFSGTKAMKEQILRPLVEQIFAAKNITYRGNVVSSIPEYEQVRIAGALYNYLRDNTTYASIFNSGSGEQTLLKHQGQCGGYGAAYVILMEMAGIDAELVAGPGHAWATVKIGSKWYHVDPTWATQNQDFFLESSNQIKKRDDGCHGSYGVGSSDPYLLRYGFATPANANLTCTTVMGDYNGNGLDQNDISTLASYIGQSGLSAHIRAISDINGDGVINNDDVNALTRRYSMGIVNK